MATAELDAAPAEVKRYQRQKLVAAIASLVLSVVVLAIQAFLIGPWLDRTVRAGLGDGPWQRLVLLAFVYAASLELFSLPLDFWSGFVLEHRYQLSTMTLRGWLWRRLKGYLVGGPLGLLLLFGLYALLQFGGDWWWAWAASGWLVVTLVLGQLLPVVILPLFYKVTPLADDSLLERLRRVAEGTGLQVEGVYRLHLSAETRKANAALAGLGRTRRVLLGDTLLDQFTPEEIEVVFAHEVGHHVHRHLAKMVVASVLLAAAGLWLVDVLARQLADALGYIGAPAYKDPGALPLLLFILTLLGVAVGPLRNAVSRYFERQCDRYALARTGLRTAYRSAFTKLAQVNKVDPDPATLEVWFFDDHPPIRERLALADAVAVVEGGAASGP